MEENRVEQSDKNLVAELLFLIKRYFALILALMILSVSVGIGYAMVRKPNYIASVMVNFTAPADDRQPVSQFNREQSYIKSVVDFCDEGVVVDRANFYYMKWLDAKYNDVTIEDFVAGIDNILYDKNSKTSGYIFAENITTEVSPLSNNYTNKMFKVKYQDEQQELAKEKALILVEAFAREVELKAYDERTGNNELVYFKINVEITSKGCEDISVDLSKTTIVLISGVIGVLLCAVVIYVITMLDKGVKSKDELERITGVQVVGQINRIGGRKNARR